MRINLAVALSVLAAGCAPSQSEVAEFLGLPQGVGVEVTWSILPGGERATCGHDEFGLPEDPGQEVTCHWECGSLGGAWESVWVTFPHPGGGVYVDPVEVRTNPACFAPGP